MPEEEEPQEKQEGEEEQPAETDNYCDFTVLISDLQQKKGMIVEATSIDSEVTFNNVMMSNDLTRDANLNRFDRQMNHYSGPDFSTLDERIQTAITEYLSGFGIDEHLCAFVECITLDKDQRLYMKWLSGLKDFVDK
jgi:complement component 1 Q subcomponent-binding protein